MHIHIEQIKEEGLSLEFEETAETFPALVEMVAKGECEFPDSIKTVLRALRIDDMVQVKGSIETSVRLSCSRCLQTLDTPVKSRFTLTFKHREMDVEGEAKSTEVELSAEDMAIAYFQGEEIDLQNTIQEQVVLAFPIKAICKPDCKGLCPKCGADLNEADCDCDRTPSPGKFTALKNLKLKKR